MPRVFVVFCAIWCTSCELVLGSIPDAAPTNEGGVPGAGGATGNGGALGAGGLGQGQGGSSGSTGAGASTGVGGSMAAGGSTGAGGQGGSTGAGGQGGSMSAGGQGGRGGAGESGGTAGAGGTSMVDGSCGCDCDGDGHDSTATNCRGDDCDDRDNQAFPGQTMYFDRRTNGTGNFDFNCDGNPEPRYPTPVNCPALALLMCDTTTMSFLGTTVPACGAQGRFGHCIKGTVDCSDQVQDTGLVQTCR